MHLVLFRSFAASSAFFYGEFRAFPSTPSRFFSTSQPTCIGAVGSMASLLKSRAVVRFSGLDTVKFLQSLLSNDIRRFEDPMGEENSNPTTPNMPDSYVPPMYSALLSPKGRFLFDMFVYRPPRSHEKLDRHGSGPGPDDNRSFELLMDVDRSTLDDFLDTFNKFRLRSKVVIESVDDKFLCWQRFGPSLSQRSPCADEPDAASIGCGGGIDEAGSFSAERNGNGWRWFRDPRLDCLGFRGIFPSETRPPLVEADKETDEGNYLTWRVINGVAEGPIEIPRGEAIPLEYNFEGLNGISFKKGCYVGQELMALTRNRGVIRKRLVPLRFTLHGNEHEGVVLSGSHVVNASSRRKVGVVTTTTATSVGSRGLGLLRLEDALTEQPSLTLEDHDVKVEPSIPQWWPPSWLTMPSQ